MAHAASDHPGEQRRRSTRIEQSVPLTIRGVDLLGQPFEERTSTLVLNLHGCKYVSKHHLPKNTWLTLELPAEGPELERRCVRARVAWIQRPRTVRELFQIGVELESAANVWRVALPPQDWDYASEPGTSEAPAFILERTAMMRTPDSPLEPHFRGDETHLAGAELPASLANYMERLLLDAKLQVQSAFSADATPTAKAGASPLLFELSAQLARQAEKAVEAATSQVGQIILRATETIDRERQASSEAFHRQWQEGLEHERVEANEQFRRQLVETQQAFRTSFAAELEEKLERSRNTFAELELQTESLRGEIGGAVEAAAAKLEQLRAERDALEASRAAQQEQKEISREESAASEQAGARWRERLEAEMVVARGQWNELLQSSLDSAVQRLVARLSESAQGAVGEAEQKMAARLAEFGQPLAQSIAEARDSISNIRAALEQEVTRAKSSLAEIEQAADHMSEYSAQLDAASQDTVNELHRRLETILATQTVELNRRAEGLAGGLTERLKPLLEAAGQQFISRSVAEVETKLAPHLERAQESLRQLSTREAQTEDTLRVHRERLRQASEQNQREASAQLAETLAQLRGEFEEARKEALAKWSEELNASGVRATHTALEEMVKASDWHEQNTQASLQSLVEKAIENAARGLELKSDDISRRFSTELDHQRSSHVKHTRNLLDTAAGEAVERVHGQLDEAAEAAAATFGEVLRGLSSQSLERFAETSRGALDERTAQLEAVADQVRRNLQGDAERSLEHFHGQLSGQVEQALADARQQLAAQLDSTLDSLRTQRDAKQQEWLGEMKRLEGESVAQYQEGLSTVCDSWMVASVRKLNEHGQNVIDSLARAAEQSLRNTCTKVFDGLAEVLREQLLGGASRSAAGAPVPTNEATAPSEKSFQA